MSDAPPPPGAPRPWIDGPWLPVLTGLAAAAVALPMLSAELGSLGGDNASYVMLARALRDGQGHVTTWEPGPPTPHTLYPPGLPLLLLPWIGGAPGSFLAAHVVIALCGGLAAGLLTALFRRRGLPPLAAAGCALAPTLSVHWLRCAADLLAELPAMAAVAGALLLLDPGDPERRDPAAPSARRVAAAAACVIIAFGFRTASIALVGPALLALVAARALPARAARIAAVAVAVACGVWFVRGALLAQTGGSYFDALALHDDGLPLAVRAWSRLTGQFLRGVPSYLLPFDGPVATWLGRGLWAAAYVGLLAGLWRRRTRAVTELFFLAHLVLVCAWTYDDARFALPLAPLLAGFALEGVRVVATTARAPTRGTALALAIAGVALVGPNLRTWAGTLLPRAHRSLPGPAADAAAPDVAGLVETWRWNDTVWAAAAPGVGSWLQAVEQVRTDPDLPAGTVLSHNHRVTTLLADRPGVRAPRRVSPTRVAAFLVEHDVRLVIVPDAAPFVDEHSLTLRSWLRAGHPGAVVHARLPGGATLLVVPPGTPR